VVKHAEAAPGSKLGRIFRPFVRASLQPPHGHFMRGSLPFADQLVLHAEIGKHLSLRLGGVDTQVKKVDQVTLVNHTIAATGGAESLLHASHDVVAGFFALVVFLGNLFFADLLKQLLVLVDEEIHLPDGAVDVVLGALNVAVDL